MKPSAENVLASLASEPKLATAISQETGIPLGAVRGSLTAFRTNGWAERTEQATWFITPAGEARRAQPSRATNPSPAKGVSLAAVDGRIAELEAEQSRQAYHMAELIGDVEKLQIVVAGLQQAVEALLEYVS